MNGRTLGKYIHFECVSFYIPNNYDESIVKTVNHDGQINKVFSNCDNELIERTAG